MNLSAVRSVAFRALNTTSCRHPGCDETKALGHVLGSCRKTDNRHHRVRTMLADFLRQQGLEVHEEVHCISEDDSTRRADIVAIDRKKNTETILDLTIRFVGDAQQPKLTDDGKRIIYES